jgi:hypothetical protein
MGIQCKEFIDGAYTLSGVIGLSQRATGAQTNIGLKRLVELLDFMNANDLDIYNIQQLIIPTNGQQVYTVGPGGNIDVPVRPPQLSGLWFRQITTPPYNDIPVRLVSATDWGNIRAKGITGNIQFLAYYDQNFPTANIYTWPVTPAGYQLLVEIENLLPTTNLTLTTMLNFPPSYAMAIRFNLAVNLAMEYGQSAPVDVQSRAAEAMLALQKNNGQLAQRMSFDASLMNQPGGIYNSTSDEILQW